MQRSWINTVSLDHVQRGMAGGFTQADHQPLQAYSGGQLTDAAYLDTAAPELPADPPAAGAGLDQAEE